MSDINKIGAGSRVEVEILYLNFILHLTEKKRMFPNIVKMNVPLSWKWDFNITQVKMKCKQYFSAHIHFQLSHILFYAAENYSLLYFVVKYLFLLLEQAGQTTGMIYCHYWANSSIQVFLFKSQNSPSLPFIVACKYSQAILMLTTRRQYVTAFILFGALYTEK